MKTGIWIAVMGFTLAAAAAAGCGRRPAGSETAQDNSVQQELPDQTETGIQTSGYSNIPESQIILTVDIAASLSDAMMEIADIYQEKHGNLVLSYNADSSGTLKNQIEEAAGTDVDLFFSAAKDQMDALVEEGYVEADTVEDLLKNRVVLIAAKDSHAEVTGFQDMMKAKNLALAGESVPVGRYTRQILQTLGISEEVLSMEINACENVSAVKTAVAEGANEIGTVYYSDYYSVRDDVKLLAVAEEAWCDPVAYPAGIVKNPNADEKQKAAAREFLSFLKSAEAKEIFEKYMFITE